MRIIGSLPNSIAPVFLMLCAAFAFQGCDPNLYRVEAEIRGFRLEDRPGVSLDSAGRGWYYTEIGTRQGNVLIRFDKFKTEYGTDSGSVKSNRIYSIDEKELTEGFKTTFRRGLNFGTFVVPFKFRPARVGNPANVFASSSLGPYIGYRRVINEGFDITPAVFAGFSSIALNDVNTKEINNLFGLTYGGGIVVAINKDFQLGAVFGWDFVGGRQGADWPYNNALWLSFAVGYKFLNF